MGAVETPDTKMHDATAEGSAVIDRHGHPRANFVERGGPQPKAP
jgi:hypothetical protein